MRWSGPLSWTKRNSGGCHLLLLQISIKADTGCLPAERKIINYLHACGNKLWIQGEGGTRRNSKSYSPDRSFIAAEKFPDLFCALSPTATRPFKQKKKKSMITEYISRFKIIIWQNNYSLYKNLNPCPQIKYSTDTHYSWFLYKPVLTFLYIYPNFIYLVGNCIKIFRKTICEHIYKLP